MNWFLLFLILYHVLAAFTQLDLFFFIYGSSISSSLFGTSVFNRRMFWNVEGKFISRVIASRVQNIVVTTVVQTEQVTLNFRHAVHCMSGAVKNMMRCAIWYYLYDLKDVKDTHGGVLILVKPATLLKLTFLHGCFSRFWNYINGTKLRNAPHMNFVFPLNPIWDVFPRNKSYMIIKQPMGKSIQEWTK